MVCFQNQLKIPIWINFGESCNGNSWNFFDHLVYFTAIGNIFRSFGIFSGHLVYFLVIWYMFPRFGILYQEKSGNPALKASKYLNAPAP
jgi:hypothetical protein